MLRILVLSASLRLPLNSDVRTLQFMDALESLSALFVAFRYWRIILCALSGIVLATALAQLTSWFSVEAAYLFAFLASSAGVMWQVAVISAKEAGNPQRKPTSISKPVAFLGVAAIGGLVGHLAASALGITAAIIVVAIAPFLLAPLFASLTKQSISHRQTLFALSASLVGLATPYAISVLLSPGF